MGWIIAFIAITIFIVTGVTGVAHPLLYGIFIAAVILVPLFLGNGVITGIIDALFGRRR